MIKKVFYNECKMHNKWEANVSSGKFRWKIIGSYYTRKEAEKALEEYVPPQEKRSTENRRQCNFKLRVGTLTKLARESQKVNKSQWEIIEEALNKYWR